MRLRTEYVKCCFFFFLSRRLFPDKCTLRSLEQDNLLESLRKIKRNLCKMYAFTPQGFQDEIIFFIKRLQTPFVSRRSSDFLPVFIFFLFMNVFKIVSAAINMHKYLAMHGGQFLWDAPFVSEQIWFCIMLHLRVMPWDIPNSLH